MTVTVSKHHETRDSKQSTTKPNIGDGERIASIFAGTILTLLGLSRKGGVGAAITLVGGGLALRGISGFSPLYKAIGTSTAEPNVPGGRAGQGNTIQVDRSVLINRKPQELYAFWRNFENLPGFMKHLQSVQVYDEKRSHWVARAPMNGTVEWEAEIVDEQEGEYIVWRSIEKSDIPNTGRVNFTPAPEGRGTQVRVLISYEPPGGSLGKAFLSLFGEEPAQQVTEDLRRFKALMETGEIATIAGQPRGVT